MEQPAPERQWTEHEKIYLLAEILKAAPVPSHVLFGFIRDNQVQVRWNDMALPPDRSVHSSQRAYNDIANTLSTTGYTRPPLPNPNMYSGPELARKRPLPQEAVPIGRLLQPRPPHPYVSEYAPPGPTYASSMNAGNEPANKKKRGRPTKAEAQQRAQEAAARGEVYPPPRRGRQSIAAHPEPSLSGPSPEQRPQAHTPPQTTIHASPTNTMTPQHQMHTEESSESSSSKKRRVRPQPLELEKSQRHSSEMQSPLAYGSTDPSRSIHSYSSFTPISAPLPSSADSRDRDTRMEGVEDAQPRTTTPHSFKDTVGI